MHQLHDRFDEISPAASFAVDGGEPGLGVVQSVIVVDAEKQGRVDGRTRDRFSQDRCRSGFSQYAQPARRLDADETDDRRRRHTRVAPQYR